MDMRKEDTSFRSSEAKRIEPVAPSSSQARILLCDRIHSINYLRILFGLLFSVPQLLSLISLLETTINNCAYRHQPSANHYLLLTDSVNGLTSHNGTGAEEILANDDVGNQQNGAEDDRTKI